MSTCRSTVLLSLAAALGAAAGLLVVPAGAQELVVETDPLEARVWLDRGVDPVLRYGDRTRIYYRVSEDAYVAIFHIDTDGVVRIAYPRSPGDVNFARGGRDYRLLFPRSPYWHVSDPPGVGYFFIVASPTPMDFSAFGGSPGEREWDLSPVGRQIYQDPYVAMDDYVAYLIPEWEYEEYALDFSAYHVGQTYSYPRFLCYDCHGYQAFAAWNPYHYSCRNFRIVVYNDPYFYPSTRYRGNRVVFVRPPAPGQPQFVFKERAAGEPGTPVVRSRPAASERSGVSADPAARRGGAVSGSGRSEERARDRRGAGRASESTPPVRPSGQLPRRDAAARGDPRAGTGNLVPRDRPAPDARGITPEPGRAGESFPRRPSSVLPDRSGAEGGVGAGGRPGRPGPAIPPRGAGVGAENSERAKPGLNDPAAGRTPPASSGAVPRGGAAGAPGGGATPRVTPPPERSPERPRPVLERRPPRGGGGAGRPAASPPSRRTPPPARRDPPPARRPDAAPPVSRPPASRPDRGAGAGAGSPSARTRSPAPPSRAGSQSPPARSGPAASRTPPRSRPNDSPPPRRRP